jgi:EthD domain
MDDFQTEPAPVYKVLLFLKRRPGMSVEAFRDYYENTHSKLGEKYSRRLLRYIRLEDEKRFFDRSKPRWRPLWNSTRRSAR